MTRRAGLAPGRILLLTIALGMAGCGPTGVDTTYGRSRGSSINGTGVLADLFRDQGFEVKAASRVDDKVGAWADVLVRFSGHPGPPDVEEGAWLLRWLLAKKGRRLLYVPRDYDAEPEFWARMLEAQPKDAPAETLDRLRRARLESRTWASELPPRPKNPAKATEWFAVDPRPAPPSECKKLEGPWAEGVDARAAAIVKHEGFLSSEEDQPVLLKGDGTPIAITWSVSNGSRVLALANASYLLNASLLNRARRPLAMQVVGWLGSGPGHVQFLEGADVLSTASKEESPASSPFHLFSVAPFGIISAHVLTLLAVLALSQAVRLGRPRAEPPSGVERPSAHPEALGYLLGRTGRADAALALLETYRRWRHPSSSAASGRSTPGDPPSPPSPLA